MKMYTEGEVRDLLRKECEKVGGQRIWATNFGINQGYVSLAMSGKTPIGEKIALALGLKKVVCWVIDRAQ